MKFGFDIDDTLINLREHAFHLYGRKLGREVAIERFRECATISVHELFGLSAEEGRRMWQELQGEIYYTACPPFPDAVEVLHELVRRGHEVYYITARTPEHCERTRAWLIAAGFPVAEGRFYCGMGDTEKIHVIRELGLDYYFDDKPAVLNTLGDLDLQVYAKDNGYNRHLDIPRIGSWRELLDLLKE
ncbi:5' nucleotidase, NT5C type [Cohnella nanjingensis]|uniref:Nucleotidase n=1 Tax=Cohnella nanjingensis TaxID=1387779 RepID=A0A7X0RSU2_9BACL|nr:HAD hydrolase-like protein [Cohnella nanjingensis]MBB6671554.1 HAD hydrolase-like protein [Cohnella nanjingensis]